MGHEANESVPVIRVTSSSVEADGKKGVMGEVTAMTSVPLCEVGAHLATIVCACYDAAADVEIASGVPVRKHLRAALVAIGAKAAHAAGSSVTLLRKDGTKDHFDFGSD